MKGFYMSWDESADYQTDLDIPSGKFGKLIAIPGGPGPSGPPGPQGEPGPAGPPGPTALREFDTVTAFPATGEAGKVYLAKDTGDTYRWDGTARVASYVRISERVTSAGIEDSTLIGRQLVTAATERTGRASILAVGRVKPAVGVAATDAASLTDALALDPVVRAEDGTYLVTKVGVNIPAGRTLRVGVGSSVKLADAELSAVNTATTTRAVRLYSGSRFEGHVNGNRAGQDKTAFNAAGGANAGIKHSGIYAAGASQAAAITNVHVDATVSGVVDYPLYFENVNDSYVRLRATDCGGAVLIKDCNNIYVDLVIDASDNAGWKVMPHAVDFIACSRIRGRIVIKGQKGTGTTAAGTALSSWISGLTMVDCSDVQLDVIDAEFADLTGQMPGVGVTLLGCRRMNVAQTRIVGYSDVLLELGGVVDSTFSDLNLDGRYQTSSTSAAGRGVALYNLATRPDFKGRTNEYTNNVKFLGGTIRRCLGAGAEFNKAAATSWQNVSFLGSKFGVKFVYLDVETGNQPAQAKASLRNHSFVDCRFSFNERSGVEIWDAMNTAFYACRANNNGQSNTFGVCRDGAIADNDSSGFITRQKDGQGQVLGTPKPGMSWSGCEVTDTQNYTAPGFLDPNRPTIVAVDLPERYCFGQVIKIAGAGAAGAELKTYIRDIVHDELVLATAASTFPTVTLTGTIAVSGSVVTGTGTQFLTDLVGRAYIKVGSEYRRVNKVSSNTAATVETAFSAAVPAGTPLVIVRATITATPSQQYGYWVSEDTVDPTILSHLEPAGNVIAAYDLKGRLGGLVSSFGRPLGVKVLPPAGPSIPGRQGQWATNATHMFAYTGDGTTHSWGRVAMETNWVGAATLEGGEEITFAEEPANPTEGADQ